MNIKILALVFTIIIIVTGLSVSVRRGFLLGDSVSSNTAAVHGPLAIIDWAMQFVFGQQKNKAADSDGNMTSTVADIDISDDDGEDAITIAPSVATATTKTTKKKTTTTTATTSTQTKAASSSKSSTTTQKVTASSSKQTSTSTSSKKVATGGGVSASPTPASSSTSPEDTKPTQSSTTPTSTKIAKPAKQPKVTMKKASFNSSTLAVDLAWDATTTNDESDTKASGTPVYKISSKTGTTTTLITTTTETMFSYPISEASFTTSTPLQFEITVVFGDGSENSDPDSSDDASTVETDPISLPDWGTVIQPIDDTNSNGSWYSDNWYDLGTGFYGTIRALTLEGFVDDSDYFASHLYLEEYIDAGYSQLNQTYTVSDNAAFTNGLRKITIGDLDIPLQPNKYYRLRTYQDFQNRSVILAGTSATGSAMWNEFIYGTGRVNNYYSFYPYVAAVMVPDYPPLAPPDQISSLSIDFDSLSSLIDISWPAATDPDTTSSLLRYQINLSSSTSLDEAEWQGVTSTPLSLPVVFGNAYIVGVRAIDDLGNVGTPLIEPWNFPAGYAPPPQQLGHSIIFNNLGTKAQEMTFLATTTVSGIGFWVNGMFGPWCCSQTAVSIHQNASGTLGDVIATSNTIFVGPSAGDGERMYQFADPPTLSPGTYWFSIDLPSNTNDIQVFGSPDDSYSGGEWFTAPPQDAYFRIQESTPSIGGIM